MSNYWDRRSTAAKTKTVREPKQLQTHLFVHSGRFERAPMPDGSPQPETEEICDRPDCEMPRWFRVHDLPDTVDAAALDRRRVGEGSDSNSAL